MGQVARFKLAKAPPTKPRRTDRVALVATRLILQLERRYRAMAARAAAHNVAVGVYAPARSTAVH